MNTFCVQDLYILKFRTATIHVDVIVGTHIPWRILSVTHIMVEGSVAWVQDFCQPARKVVSRTRVRIRIDVPHFASLN